MVGVCPVPLKAMLCGLSAALSVMVTLALREPLAEGEKVTVMVQVPLAATLLGQLLVWAKSLAFVPDRAILLMLRDSVPLFVRVTVCAVLVVFTFWLPKLKLVGLKFTAGDGLKPVPLSATFCGLFVALSVRVRLALRLPR